MTDGRMKERKEGRKKGRKKERMEERKLTNNKWTTLTQLVEKGSTQQPREGIACRKHAGGLGIIRAQQFSQQHTTTVENMNNKNILL